MATILWVEDQQHWIDKFSPLLLETDFDQQPTELLVFKFAEAACQQIRLMKQAPDLAILDANMNGNDDAGFSVSRAIDRKWPDLPVIYLSEYSGTPIEQKAFEATRAQDFVAKHQNNVEEVLVWRIKRVLRTQQISQTGANKESTPSSNEQQLCSGELRLDLSTWEVYWKGQRLMNPANPKRPLAPTPRKILKQLMEASPRPLTTLEIAERMDLDLEKFSYASYRQHIKILRHSFDQAEGGSGQFLALCQQGQGIVTLGDEGAYSWRPVKDA